MLKFCKIFHRITRTYRTQLMICNSVNRLEMVNRKFHCSASLCVKMFMEHENNYAYSVMESKGYSIPISLKKVKSSTLTKDQFDNLIKKDWSKVDPKEIFEGFSMLAEYCAENNIQISNRMFDNFIDCLTNCIKSASDKELESVFFSLAKWPEPESIRTRNFIEVWAALDDECLNRLQMWTFDQQFYFISLFFMLNATKFSDFTHKCILKFASKAKQLTPGQLVQTFFYIGVQRKQPFDMHNLELCLENNFSEFSIDDLAIISMGFFKSKTPIRSMVLVEKIAEKIMECSNDVNEVSLAALLKIIRYSMKIPKTNIIFKLLDTLQHEVPRLSMMCNVHLALVGTSTLTLHKGCLTKIAESIISNLSTSRLKDLERLVLTYGTFNFKPLTKECIFERIMEELRNPQRELEVQKYGRSYACCIAYLGLLGIYPVDLMSKVLSSEFLLKTYGKQCFAYGREILTIHNTSQIFCKEAEMNRLDNRAAIILAKKHTDYVPNENYKKQYNVSEKMFLDVLNVLIEHRGAQYVVGDHIVTHHQRGGTINFLMHRNVIFVNKVLFIF